MKNFLTKEDILKADDRPTEEVHIPEWGGSVFVRTLSGIERDRLEASLLADKTEDKIKNYENLRARLVVASVVDEKGKNLFGHKDIEALGEKSGKALDRVFSVAQKLSGLGPDDVEELTKNLKGARRGASTSDSRES